MIGTGCVRVTPLVTQRRSVTETSTTDMGTATARLSQVLRNGSFEDISKLLPYIPGNVVDINIMSILNCCFKSSDLLHLFSYMVDSKYYLSSYLYECFIITAGRIGDSHLVTTLYESAVKKNGRLTSLVDAVFHAYRVCDAHQKVISYTYQLFSENVRISSSKYEDILRTLTTHKEYDSLCLHIVSKMQEEHRFLSLPILSILLNTIDIRLPALTVGFIRQTRYFNENPPLLNTILSREITKFSEKKQPEGMFEVYKEMSRRHLHLNTSEESRLRRVIGELMKANYSFSVRNDDDLFTRLYAQCWLEQKRDVAEFAERIKESGRNRSIELFEVFKFVGKRIFHDQQIATNPTLSVSVACWKKLIDLRVVLPTNEMLVGEVFVYQF